MSGESNSMKPVGKGPKIVLREHSDNNSHPPFRYSYALHEDDRITQHGNVVDGNVLALLIAIRERGGVDGKQCPRCKQFVDPPTMRGIELCRSCHVVVAASFLPESTL